MVALRSTHMVSRIETERGEWRERRNERHNTRNTDRDTDTRTHGHTKRQRHTTTERERERQRETKREKGLPTCLYHAANAFMCGLLAL